MVSSAYQKLQISSDDAEKILFNHFGLKGKASALPGEFDMNFKIMTDEKDYLLKVSRPVVNNDFLEFQQKLLEHLAASEIKLNSPTIIKNLQNESQSEITDDYEKSRKVSLYSWIPGRLWSSVNPVTNHLLFSLGNMAGKLTLALQGFDHPIAHRYFEWDLCRAEWAFEKISLFKDEELATISYYHELYREIKPKLADLRKSIVHNDVNDNNIIVSYELTDPEVEAIIDFGDAIYTALINDVAITITYAVMNKPDPLAAALWILKGYHQQMPLKENELELLYALVGIRLVISLTKSAINSQKEPDNTYLQISKEKAWKLLRQWREVNLSFAHYSFREVCGYPAHPDLNSFKSWAKKQGCSIGDLFPKTGRKSCISLDLGMESTFAGHEDSFNDLELFDFKIGRMLKEHPVKIPAGGYLETRPLYGTDNYKKEGNNGPEYRSVHLGIDFWQPAETSVYALFEGIVVLANNDIGYKEYGGLVVLQHTEDNLTFYTLYGHQSVDSVRKLEIGDHIKKGERISELGTHEENGSWGTHLHFQIMLDLLGYKDEFPGVCYPGQKAVWTSICPDPNLLFKDKSLINRKNKSSKEIQDFRNLHLGKSLSLSFKNPLFIVRGEGAYLFDETGRKYLDTVNNVAHVGHEHPRVVKAGQDQMAILNTNTRYLHQNINAFVNELLETFPPELSVVHFVNSGSEANDLALRMAKTFTRRNDIIAVEAGYHGNTGACIDISSYKFDGKGGNGAPEHTHIVPLPDAFRGRYRGKNTGDEYANHIQEQIDSIQKKGRNVAAFICESIISCGGQIELPDNYLNKAYEYIHKAGGICIADEVQVGCGRVGKKFWGFQLHSVVPDIVTIGKPIGNGHPLAAVICTREVADAFANGMEYFNTYGGNPVSCAIGKEVLSVIKDEKLQEHALAVGDFLKDELFKLQVSHPIIGDVRGQGLFLGFELTDLEKHPLGDKADYLANRMKEFGILMSTDGPDHNVIKIKPPMVFTRQNTEELIMRLKQVFREDFMQID